MDWNEQTLAERLRGKSIFFATPAFGAQVYLNYHISMLQTLTLLAELHVGYQHAPTGGDSLVHRARNVLVGKFLESDCTHMMCIDADIGWQSHDVVKLLAGCKDIVGGIYPKKCYPLAWPANFFVKDEELKVDPDTHWLAAKDLPTGFLLVSRHAIKSMIEKHPEWKCTFDPEHASEPNSYSIFDCYTDDDGVYLSEDFAFCRRAQAEGFMTWADPTIVLTHFGGHMFGGSCIADWILPQAETEIEGWMAGDELRWLKTAAARMDSACEIGSWKGRSTHALLSKITGPVYAVDHWQGSPDDLEGAHCEAAAGGDIFGEFMKNVGEFPNLVVVKGDSGEVAEKIPQVDMVFIDGSHRYEDVKRDIELYRPKAKSLICGHDFQMPGVKRAVKEIFGPRAQGAAGSIWQVWL
jgi:hypothetical protein